MHSRIHWQDGKDLLGQVQGMFKSPLPYPLLYQHHGSSHQTGQFPHHEQGVPGCNQDHKGGHFIKVNDPALNRNWGKYQLPHFWDEVVQDVPALCLQWYPHFPSGPTWTPPPHYMEAHPFLVVIGKYNISFKTWRSIVGDDITKACLTKILCSVLPNIIGV